MSMWEDFIKCFKKGVKIKGCTDAKIAELFDRVPPGQRKQLREFAKKHDEYRQRVRKYPDKMPTIDWKYYRENVRKEMVGWVNEYEKKYDKLDSMFGDRHHMIDFSKYFGEISAQTKEVQQEVECYKAESEKRIKILQARMKELECMKPYAEMTMEEFCLARPNEAPDFRNKPTFWPHNPEEQVEAQLPDESHGHEESKEVKPDPKKPPPKAPPAGTAGKDAKPETPPKTKEPEAKEAKAAKEAKEAKDAKKPDPPKKVEKVEAVAVKVEEKESLESQITDKVTDLASKGIDLVKDLGSKAIVLLNSLWEKAESKRKEVAKTADAERQKKESSDATVKTAKTVSSKDLGGSSDICTKTIIRGEDTAKADVKEHHVDLTIEGDSDAEAKEKSDKDVCKEKEKEKEKCKRDVATVCFEKVQEKLKDERLCAAEREKSKAEDDDKKCKPNETTSLSSDAKSQTESKKPLTTGELKQVPLTNVIGSPAPNLDVKTSSTADENIVIGMHQEVLTAENEIYLGSKQISEEPKDKQSFKDKAEKVIKCVDKVLNKNQKEIDTQQKDNQGKSVDKSLEKSEKVIKLVDKVLNIEQKEVDNIQGKSADKSMDKAEKVIKVVDKVLNKDQKETDAIKSEREQDVQGKKAEKSIDKAEKVIKVVDKILNKNQIETESAKVTAIKCEREDIQGKTDDKSMSDAKQQNVYEGSDEIAKLMFKMAIGAAQLLSEAKKKIEEAQQKHSGQADALQQAFEAAGKQVDQALTQAHSALESAKKLTHRAQTTLEADEQKMVATIEKHTVLAKLLANRALAMQKEIAKLLDGLKNN